MKAVEIHEFGGPETLRLGERELPTVGPNSVLVRMHTVGVNPGDARIRRGEFQTLARHVLPAVVGWEGAGTVERVGFAVTAFAPGDRVFGIFRQDYVGDGSYAEFAAVDDRQLAHLPHSIDLTVAGGLAATGNTAYVLVRELTAVQRGETVVVTGASGGVGHLVVQLAALQGAHVIAFAREENADFVRELGASEVIDHTADDAVDQVFRAHPGGVDVVIDTVGGPVQDLGLALLKEGSNRFASAVHPPMSPAFDGRDTSSMFRFLQPRRAVLDALVALVQSGELKLHVSHTYPLAEAAAAHEQIDTGHTKGKIVLLVSDAA